MRLDRSKLLKKTVPTTTIIIAIPRKHSFPALSDGRNGAEGSENALLSLQSSFCWYIIMVQGLCAAQSAGKPAQNGKTLWGIRLRSKNLENANE